MKEIVYGVKGDTKTYSHLQLWMLVEAMAKDGIEVSITRHYTECPKKYRVTIKTSRNMIGNTSQIAVNRGGKSPFDALVNTFEEFKNAYERQTAAAMQTMRQTIQTE